ncbi:MAG TPA: hypothetical protein VK694_04240 [Verrucomicrobiae bacterium]|nr:hypothetical protein [Verrucomicrobiae bacterium]
MSTSRPNVRQEQLSDLRNTGLFSIPAGVLLFYAFRWMAEQSVSDGRSDDAIQSWVFGNISDWPSVFRGNALLDCMVGCLLFWMMVYSICRSGELGIALRQPSPDPNDPRPTYLRFRGRAGLHLSMVCFLVAFLACGITLGVNWYAGLELFVLCGVGIAIPVATTRILRWGLSKLGRVPDREHPGG